MFIPVIVFMFGAAHQRPTWKGCLEWQRELCIISIYKCVYVKLLYVT